MFSPSCYILQKTKDHMLKTLSYPCSMLLKPHILQNITLLCSAKERLTGILRWTKWGLRGKFFRTTGLEYEGEKIITKFSFLDDFYL